MNELEFQQKLKTLIRKQLDKYDPQGEIYAGNEFKNTTSHWAKKPDLILKTTKLPKELSIIGIECKLAKVFGEISKGIIQQTLGEYFGEKYLIRKTKKEVKLTAMCFTTKPAIEKQVFYAKHWGEASKFFLERIINEMNKLQDNYARCSLTFDKKNLLFYYKNRNWKLNGKFELSKKENYKWDYNGDYEILKKEGYKWD